MDFTSFFFLGLVGPKGEKGDSAPPNLGLPGMKGDKGYQVTQEI
jgi:hypothetical protein